MGRKNGHGDYCCVPNFGMFDENGNPIFMMDIPPRYFDAMRAVGAPKNSGALDLLEEHMLTLQLGADWQRDIPAHSSN